MLHRVFRDADVEASGQPEVGPEHHRSGSGAYVFLGEAEPSGSISEGDLQRQLHGSSVSLQGLDDATARELLSDGVRILASAPECYGPELVQPLVDGEVTVTLVDTPRELSWRPRDGVRRFIGLPRYRPLSQDRVTLLLADVLLEDALDRAGYESPTIDQDRDTYVRGMSERKASKVARLCSFAFDLSRRPDPGVGDIRGELRAMGHGEAMDVFERAENADEADG